MPSPFAPTRLRDYLLLFFLLALFFSLGLGLRDFMAPSEARYIEIPRQMLATGNWLTPHINGVPYFEKPPLFYWLQAAGLWLFGLNEFGGRIVTALLAAGTCVATCAIGRLLFSPRAGFLAALVLATCLLGYGMSGVAALDLPLTFFVTLCIGSFLFAVHTGRAGWFYAMYAAAALAVLTKGLIGMVLPGLVIGAWIIIERRWPVLLAARIPTGTLLFLAIAAPWHIAMMREHPQFFDFYIIHEHFTRYLTKAHHRVAPWWYFIAVTLGGLLPWTGLLPAAMRKSPRDGNWRFLLLWSVLPLIFFSVSHSKLISYIFPIFPPLALWLGQYLALKWELPAGERLRRYAGGIIMLYAVVLLCLPLLPMLPGKAQIAFAMIKNLRPAMLLPFPLLLALAAVAAARAQQSRTLIVLLGVLGAGLGFTANAVIARIDQSGVRPLAEKILEKMAPGDEVVTLGGYFQDLPVYLNRNVRIAGWTGELAFGYEHYPHTHSIMLDPDAFWQLCRDTPHRFFVVMEEKHLSGFAMPADCRLLPLAHYGKTLLLEKAYREH